MSVEMSRRIGRLMTSNVITQAVVDSPDSLRRLRDSALSANSLDDLHPDDQALVLAAEAERPKRP